MMIKTLLRWVVREGIVVIALLGLVLLLTAAKPFPESEVNPLLSTNLQILVRQAGGIQPQGADSGTVDPNEEIVVILEPVYGSASRISNAAVLMAGGRVLARSSHLVRARVPINRLGNVVNNVSGIMHVREPLQPVTLAVVSQGVALTGASDFHTAGFEGQGAKVAIIDLGFDGLSEAQTAGELQNVVFTHDYTGTGLEADYVHGTGVAEVVEDMAPQADLYLMKISDSVDLQNAVQDCIDNGVHIINHSVGWYNSNYYDGTGIIGAIASNARANDILWVNSAGNEASDGHWQDAFVDTDGDGYHEFSSGSDYLDGDSRDEGSRIYATGGDTVVVYMSWDDWTASDQDYDLFLYNSWGVQVASSTGYQTGFQSPTEAIFYDVPTTGYYEIAIQNYSASQTPEIEFFAYCDSGADTGLEHHDPASSIITPANSADVLAVGAIRRTNWTTGPQESFSSQGPSNASQYASSRTKPDVSGPDGTSSYMYGSFYGTSASSPHVAGAAALLISQDSGRTSDDLQVLLESSAIDMGSAGKDNVYGAGRINLEVTVPPVASPPALVTNFAASDGEDGQSTLTWTNPSDGDLGQVVVQRKTGSYPTDHTDGTTVYDNASPTPSAPISTADTGRTNGTPYYYAVFSRDATDWNETVTAGQNADTGTPAEPAPPSSYGGYWRFNEGAGSAVSDSSGNGNDGTISDANWTTSVDASGALSFDGVNDYVTIPDSASLNITGSAITIEAWIKREGDTGDYEMIVGKEVNGGGTDVGYYMQITPTDKLAFGFATSDLIFTRVTGTTNIVLGTWMHIAGVYDGSQMRLYINGVLDGSKAQTGNIYGSAGIGGNPLSIGRVRYQDSYYYGATMLIDEVQIQAAVVQPGDFNLLPVGGASPPALVTNFAASDGEDGQSTLTWTNPSDGDLGQVVVQRKTGSYPTDHTDGTTVYDNASPTPSAPISTTDTGRTNGTPYYYAVFSRDATDWNETVTAGQNADTGTPAEPAPPSSYGGYWRFNEGAGSAVSDSSGNGNDGTISDANWTTSVDASGALSFDGVNDYVTIPDSASLNITGSAITIEAWIKREGDTGDYEMIVGKEVNGGGTDVGYYMQITPTDKLAFGFATSDLIFTRVTGTTNIVLGTWMHIAGVYDGSQMRLYINGVLDGSKAQTGNIYGSAGIGGNPLSIGRVRYQDSYYYGATMLIDEVQIQAAVVQPGDFNLPSASLPERTNPLALDVSELARIVPSPVREAPATFVIGDVAYTQFSVDIYDLSGRRVFASGWRTEDIITWDLRTTNGDSAANGVYVCVIRAIMDPATLTPQTARILLFVNR
ncbi:LamG-like jellyroll fold domain-containing protein [Candidatus Bipolaricaulota bacterium]